MAVVGVEDEAFGQRVAAIIVRAAGGAGGETDEQVQVQIPAEVQSQLLQTLRADCGGRLAPYKLPSMVSIGSISMVSVVSSVVVYLAPYKLPSMVRVITEINPNLKPNPNPDPKPNPN